MNVQLEDDYGLLCQGELADPYPVYCYLRENDPVHWSEGFNGWLLTRYDDVYAAFTDSRLCSGGRLDSYMDKLPSDVRTECSSLRNHYATWLVNLDAPDHSRLRALIVKAFTPSVVDKLFPFIAHRVECLLKAAPRGTAFDFVSQIARPLPAQVISELLGIAATESAQFEEWSEQISAFQGTGRPRVDLARCALAAEQALSSYVRRLVASRRENPRDDLLSTLIAVEEHGDRLNENELVGMAVFLLVAGHETTMSLLSNGLLWLLRNPDQWRTVQEDENAIPSAVEEMLRYESPLQHQVRTAREAMTIQGVEIKRSDRVLLMIGAANRDPEQFAEPEVFDVYRSPNRHLAFGRGVHFCVGAPLARLEAQLFFQALVKSCSTIHLDDAQITWRRHTSMRNPQRMMVTLQG